ncbi:DUF4349 domain-containing protein [Flavobacterium sp.]|uniref:DUF4349 domain-containing protein n=1 Tax=Flavobacterium sp. TaxID=239 RepID=UPI002488A4D8|nr:DUF4349 domain-containing protein [Flavobacterium sp.]MDI1317467.1 DUF4349 domain-containing protein [Flavobacterium sp.]
MKHLSKLGLALLLFGLAFARKQADSLADSNAEASDVTSTVTSTISSNAAVEKKDSNRKFVQTADLKFKVKNVAKSTYVIENIVGKNGGFVTFTDLKSNSSEKSETKISKDSTLETNRITVDNTIRLRVPNAKLDTILVRETESDQSVLQNLNLEDQVSFSTVTLYLYQRESIQQEIVANKKNSNAYLPNIGLQIVDSLKTSWYMMKALLAFIFQLWSLILLTILGIIAYRKFIKK